MPAAVQPAPAVRGGVFWAAALFSGRANSARLDANREAALRLARAGFAVFPCRPDKTPLGRWREISTNDPERVEAMWAAHPNALVGVDCGKSGIVVIDLDRHAGGADGVEAGTALLGDLHGLHCPIIETAGGGLHLVFRQPAGGPIGNGRGSLPAGIDIRGDGGYVIGVGGTLPDGRSYEADPESPDLLDAFTNGALPDLPDAILDILRTPKPERAEPQQPRQERQEPPRGPSGGSDDRERAYARRALDENARELATAPKGGRNQALNNIAHRLGRFVGAGWIERSEVEARLEDAALAAGLGRHEIRLTLRSGIESGMRRPIESLRDDGRPDEREPYQFTRRQRPEDWAAHEGGGDTQADDDLLADALDREDMKSEPIPALVKGMLPYEGVAILGGASGAGKSFVGVDLAVSLATGQEFFGHRVREQVGVAYLAAEGAATIPSRVEVAEGHKAAFGDAAAITLFGRVPNLADLREAKLMTRELLALDAKFRAKHGLRLGCIIVDTASAALALENENDNAEVSRALKLLADIGRDTNTLVVLIHHFGKTTGQGLRGASAWRGNSESVLAVLGERDETTGLCVNRRLLVSKNRCGPEGQTIPFDLKFVKLGEDEDGDAFGSCYIEHGVPDAIIQDVPRAKSLPRAARSYLDAMNVVLAESGRRVRPFGGEGPEVLAVDRDAIRAEFSQAWPAEGEDKRTKTNARRMAFNRGEDALVKARRIATRDVNSTMMVWAVSGDQM